MEQAKMNLELSPNQLSILRRIVRGATLWRRHLPGIGDAAYFGDPPDEIEVVPTADVDVLLAGEGPELSLIEFKQRRHAMAAEASDLGTVYALRGFKGLR